MNRENDLCAAFGQHRHVADELDGVSEALIGDGSSRGRSADDPTTAAALLDKSSDLGSVAPGYTADLAVTDGNPLSDIDVAIRHVIWVMKSGSVVVDKTSIKN